MKHNENSRLYEADDGKMLVRVSDGNVIGDGVCLGDDDDISNYEEHEFTDEQREQFFKDIGMEDPKKCREAMRERWQKSMPKHRVSAAWSYAIKTAESKQETNR